MNPGDIAFETENVNTAGFTRNADGSGVTANTRFTVPHAGAYLIYWSVSRAQDGIGLGERTVTFNRNNTALGTAVTINADSTVTGSTIDLAENNDYYRLNLNMAANGVYGTIYFIELAQTP